MASCSETPLVYPGPLRNFLESSLVTLNLNFWMLGMAFLEIKQKLMSEVEALGFPRARVVRALHSTGNVSSEAAIHWLIDHENDPHIDQMPPVAVNIDIESPEPFHITEEMRRKAKELRIESVPVKNYKKQKELQKKLKGNAILILGKLRKRRRKEQGKKLYKNLNRIRSESLATKATATKAGEKDELRSQNSLPATSVSKAVSMRECLRSLRHHHKDNFDKVRNAYQTLFIYVRNVAKNPDEERFRKIRLSNPLFQERVGSLTGGIEFLELCGFRKEGEFLYLPHDKIDPEALNTAGSLLNSALTNPFFGVLQSV
ncbi:UBX domain-containing protein 1-like isoform X1 [Cucumis melo var. makuwa]|uniref:UBX domain-containing protein 1-like isoform X1 n=1 Tax=Cucumis melo var. makuwa TaxID=1194695 RepID=A0A5D3CI01_CUCMM|nr:UBX domain-containing protein 1-like isoform X1 [Cucumis melo var. makuwa]TYK10858.1 UBX domain-containing protein 1-like isoform X1 [Cucumis melo var. makuwa]